MSKRFTGQRVGDHKHNDVNAPPKIYISHICAIFGVIINLGDPAQRPLFHATTVSCKSHNDYHANGKKFDMLEIRIKMKLINKMNLNLSYWLTRVTATMSVIMLAGCSGFAPNFNDMTAAYSATLSEHERNSLLTNLVRASEGLPLQFTTIPTVVGSGTVVGTMSIGADIVSSSPSSVPGFFSAADRSVVKPGASLATSRQFNFTLAALDNEQFTRGYLSDLTVSSVNFFTSTSEVSQELLFTMIFESVFFDSNNQKERVMFKNALNKKDFDAFRDVVIGLIESGLQTEQIVVPRPIGPPITREEAVKVISQLALAGKDIQNLGWTIGEVKTPQGQRYQTQLRDLRYRFCLSSINDEVLGQYKLSPTTRCKRFKSEDSDNDDGLYRMGLNLRSTRDVFKYLGRIIKAQLDQENPWTPSILILNDDGTKTEVPILVVKRGSPPPGEKVVAQSSFLDQSYYIPYNNNGMSTEVIELLSVIVTMNKVPGSIRNSPGILLN